jgi:hypothetical protein
VEAVRDDTRNTLVNILDAVNVFRRIELAITVETILPQNMVEPMKEDTVIVLEDKLDALNDDICNKFTFSVETFIVDTPIVLPRRLDTTKADTPNVGVIIDDAVIEETRCELIIAVDAVKKIVFKVDVTMVERAVKDETRILLA